MHLTKHLFFRLVFSRHFSSRHKLSKIPIIYRPQAIRQAQQVITDYFHTTRSLPYFYAEHIGKHSLTSLSNVMTKIEFKPSSFEKSIQKFLRYNPINEFEFFLESIGIDHTEVCKYLPPKMFFFSEDRRLLSATFTLCGFGFPWNKLGLLYEEEISIFSKSSEDIVARLSEFKDYGFSNTMVIAICLAFPNVLSGNGEMSKEVCSMLGELKKVVSDLNGFVEDNSDSWYEVFRKIRVFYDLGCEKGKVGESIDRNKIVFLKYSKEILVEKVEYFCRFCVNKDEIGVLLLQSPEILNFDLETKTISVMGILKHFGLNEKELDHLAQNYSYVLGRNKMINLPHVVRALNLHEWLFNKIKNGNHELLASYVLTHPDEDLDKEYVENLERIQCSRTPIHTMNKLDFLHGIGFGQNKSTLKVMDNLHGTSKELQGRFDCMLRIGIEFSKLCRMIRSNIKILNQNPKTLQSKINFLLHEADVSLEYLDLFPGFLLFDLENRIIPRYRCHKWLEEKGLCIAKYSIASMVATSEKSFIARLYKMHPATPKHWFERFSHTKKQCSSS